MQRVDSASVTIDGQRVASVEAGLLILLGVGEGDRSGAAERLAEKCARLRIFEDGEGLMGRSLVDLGDRGAALCVSQFTLYGDTRRGTRPSFSGAASPDVAEQLYECFCESLAGQGTRVERGRFGARMNVELVNNGPVTLLLET